MTDVVTPPTISALPPAPLATDTPTEFDAKAFAMVAAQVGFVPQANALASNVFNNATAAFERTAIAQAAASAASGSASAAAGSASAASGSASAAAGSASSASTSASNAAASYTSMQKLYLGPKSSPPTTDNQGGALAVGAWYVNTALGSWFWWSGPVDGWKLGMSDVAGSFVPLAGGVNMSGFLGVPAGATGDKAPQAQEVVPRAPLVYGKSQLMGDLLPGTTALLVSTTGRGADWPIEGTDFSVQAWIVNTTGSAGRKEQTATQILFAASGQIKGSRFMRALHDAAWSDWDRVVTGRTMMSTDVVVNVPASTPTYSLDPSLGGEHVVTINATCTFNLPSPRQIGDAVTAHVISAGAIRPIVLSSNVVLPKDSTGAVLPFQQYPADGMATLLFKALRPGQWECYYGGVH